jgi:hypothetical protein
VRRQEREEARRRLLATGWIGLLADGPGLGPSGRKGPGDEKPVFEGKKRLGFEPSGPKTGMSLLGYLHEGVMPKKGPNGPDEALHEFFENMPEWLTKQLPRFARFTKQLFDNVRKEDD